MLPISTLIFALVRLEFPPAMRTDDVSSPVAAHALCDDSTASASGAPITALPSGRPLTVIWHSSNEDFDPPVLRLVSKHHSGRNQIVANITRPELFPETAAREQTVVVPDGVECTDEDECKLQLMHSVQQSNRTLFYQSFALVSVRPRSGASFQIPATTRGSDQRRWYVRRCPIGLEAQGSRCVCPSGSYSRWDGGYEACEEADSYHYVPTPDSNVSGLVRCPNGTRVQTVVILSPSEVEVQPRMGASSRDECTCPGGTYADPQVTADKMLRVSPVVCRACPR